LSLIVCFNIFIAGWQARPMLKRDWRYRMVHKCMGQPVLMKLEWSNIGENYLSSKFISVALAYFLNPLYSGSKYPIQFSAPKALANDQRAHYHQLRKSFQVLFHGKK
jgi:hypothetical protein